MNSLKQMNSILDAAAINLSYGELLKMFGLSKFTATNRRAWDRVA